MLYLCYFCPVVCVSEWVGIECATFCFELGREQAPLGKPEDIFHTHMQHTFPLSTPEEGSFLPAC